MDPRAEATALLTRVGVCVLDDQRVLRISGDDALAWLQGQVTQDVVRLAPGASAFTLLLGTNGKIRTDGWVHRRTDDLVLVLAADVAEGVLAQLDAHVIMEDVELTLDPGLAIVTVQGPEAASLRAGHESAFDADRLGFGAGLDFVVPRAEAEPIAAALGARAAEAGGARISSDGYELARIRRGIPRLGVDFGENTLPQEAGLAARGVSFTKGCYLGQEPVIMLEHRGQPPKRLFVVRARGDVTAGAALAADGGEAAGRLTSLAQSPEPDGARLGLALVKRAHAAAGATLVGGEARVELVAPVGEVEPVPGKVP